MTSTIANFAEVVPGAVWRGGQPDDSGWNALKKLGVRRILKLNTCAEAQDVAAEALGMDVAYFPIDLCEQLVFRPDKGTVRSAVDQIVPGTFVHCQHGQDRTGLVVGCYRVWRQAWVKSAAHAEMAAHGFHWELLGLSLFWEWAV